jgi:hypothetical protein
VTASCGSAQPTSDDVRFSSGRHRPESPPVVEVSEGRFILMAETTLRLSGPVPCGAGMLDYTGFRSDLRRSCPFHHAPIISHSLAVLHGSLVSGSTLDETGEGDNAASQHESAQGPSCRLAGRNDAVPFAYGGAPAISAKVDFNCVPRETTTMLIPTAIPAAIKPYSREVPPASSLPNCSVRSSTVILPWRPCHRVTCVGNNRSKVP